MRFNKYINKDIYISLLEKDKYQKTVDENIQRIVNELNRYVNCYSTQYKFTIANKMISPTDVPIKLDEKKKERLVRLWMNKCEELEDIKQKDVDNDE